jgi:Leucine-rich repeat (LRR) protein
MDDRSWEQRNMTDDELVMLIRDLSEGECLDKTEISLYGNGGLTAIPKEIKRFKNLQKLGVQGNKIVHSKVAKELSELIQIHTIYFASSLLGNSLKQIPKPIFDLINLTDITLSKCNLTYVSPALSKLTNLERLCLDENYISSLPSEIIRLKSLQTLYLRHNELPKQLMKDVDNFEKTQKILRKIYNYFSKKESKVKTIIVEYMFLLKKVLHKDLVPLIGKTLWKTRQSKSWRKTFK